MAQFLTKEQHICPHFDTLLRKRNQSSSPSQAYLCCSA